MNTQSDLPAKTASAAPISTLDDAMAKLRSAGIVMAEHSTANPFSHGVAQQVKQGGSDRAAIPT